MAVIGSLSVKLGLVTVEWDKATAQAKKQAKDLQNAFNDLGVNMKGLKNLFQQVGGAAGLSVAGFAAMSHSVLQLAGNLDDLSKTYDVSIAKVLQFQNALIQAGGKAEDAGKIMATMFGKIAEAQQGNEAAIAAFEDLGISFEQLRSMNPEQALTKVYEGLAGIGNTYDRIKAVKEILGKGGLHKSVEEIAEALGKSTAEFRRQEAALKQWAELGDRIDRMMLNLKLAFAEFFSVFAGGNFVPSVNQFKSAMVAITSVMVINGMFKLVAAFKALNTALKSTAALGMAIQSAQGIKGIAMAGGALAAYFGAMKVFESQDEAAAAEGEPSEQEGGGTPESGKTGDRRTIAAMMAKNKLARELLFIDSKRLILQAESVRGNQYELQFAESRLTLEEDIAKAKQEQSEALKADNLSQAQKGAIEEAYQIKLDKAEQDDIGRRAKINQERQYSLELYRMETDFVRERNNLEITNQTLALDQYKMNEWDYQLAQNRIDLEKRLQALYAQRVALNTRTDKQSPEFKAEQERIDAQIQGERDLNAIRAQGIEADKYRAHSFEEGWKQAFKTFSEQSQQYGRMGADMFNSVVGNMNSAIDNFVKTGKFAFKDFTKSVIQDLIAIEMKMQAMAMLRMALNAMGFTTMSGGATGKASGGMVSQGVPYMVGENGPELFVPQKGGAIVPSNRVGDALMGSGQPSVVYNGPYIANMQAMDTQSASQFLARNKMAVWSANQSAGRSVPTSR
jgi:lambda family phage tail tape measure protein